MAASPHERVTLVSENAATVVRRLKEQEGRGIYLCGGGTLAATLLAEGLIDQIVLKLNPFVMGTGIPLFGGVVPQSNLERTSCKIYENGVLFLHYRVRA
jgi:dihydrofolate reductase